MAVLPDAVLVTTKDIWQLFSVIIGVNSIVHYIRHCFNKLTPQEACLSFAAVQKEMVSLTQKVYLCVQLDVCCLRLLLCPALGSSLGSAIDKRHTHWLEMSKSTYCNALGMANGSSSSIQWPPLNFSFQILQGGRAKHSGKCWQFLAHYKNPEFIQILELFWVIFL